MKKFLILLALLTLISNRNTTLLAQAEEAVRRGELAGREIAQQFGTTAGVQINGTQSPPPPIFNEQHEAAMQQMRRAAQNYDHTIDTITGTILALYGLMALAFIAMLYTAQHCLTHCNKDDKTPYIIAIIFIPVFGPLFYWWKQPYQLSEYTEDLLRRPRLRDIDTAILSAKPTEREQAAVELAAQQREAAHRASLAKEHEIQQQSEATARAVRAELRKSQIKTATPIHIIHARRTQAPFNQAPHHSNPNDHADQ